MAVYLALYVIRFVVIFVVLIPRVSWGLGVGSLCLFLSSLALYVLTARVDPGYLGRHSRPLIVGGS